MYRNFFHVTKLNFKKFLNYLPKKNNIILDYGCGNGVYSYRDLKSKKIKLIKMTDKDKKLKFLIKNKYSKSKKIIWINKLNTSYDVVFINSVIQYMSINQYKRLLTFFFKKKVSTVIISDVPKFPRFLEAFFLLFLNPFKLIKAFNYLFTKQYRKIGFFYKDYEKLIVLNNSYIYKKEENLNDDKLLRYTLIINKL
tara:strand:- start:376 stop:963 length:588 start_codon:yes stop_codon:yes gene_type:complete